MEHTLSSMHLVSMLALASSWQVRSKNILGCTEDRGTVASVARSWLAAQWRSASTARLSASPKWKVLLDVRGSIGLSIIPSKVTVDQPKVVSRVMDPLNI